MVGVQALVKPREVLVLLAVLAACGLLARWGRETPPSPLVVATPTPAILPADEPGPARPAAEPNWVQAIPSPTPVPSPRASPIYYGVIRDAPKEVSVNGLTLWMLRSEVEAWLGPGRFDSSAHRLHYDSPPVEVSLGGTRVLAVKGTKLRLDGEVVLLVGDSRERAIEVLGRCWSPSPNVLECLNNRQLRVHLRNGVVVSIELASCC